MKRNRKSRTRIISMSLILTLLFLLTAAPAGAADLSKTTDLTFSYTECDDMLLDGDLSSIADTEETIVTDVDETADFDTDKVLVTIKRAYGEINKTYTPADFSEIGCTAVEDLTALPENVGELEYLNFEEFHQILLLTLAASSKEEVVAAIRTLEAREDILSAEPNYRGVAEPCSVPNDTYYSSQWGLQKIQAPSAWNLTTGSGAVTVGIIDSGIQFNHPDLVSNVAGGYDFYNQTASSYNVDNVGHGTHVAGIIGAKGNNGTGISGVCWNVAMYMMRVSEFDSFDDTAMSAIVSAINYAIENNIQILNFSIKHSVWDNSSFLTAVKNYTGLFVVAAGNDSECINTNSSGAALSRLDNVIMVAATNANDNLSSLSNYGQYTVDLAAPGTNIYSTYPISSYVEKDGTSVAAPFVTGTAALVKSQNPDASTAEIKRTILDNVDVVSSLSGYVTTGGRLNTYKAVKNTVIYDDIVTSSANGYKTSYTITLKNVRFGDGSAPIAVKFPSWSPGGSAVWYEGARISGTNDWQVTVNYANHSYVLGSYATNIYVYGANGQPISVTRPVHVDLASVDGSLRYEAIKTYSGNDYASSYVIYLKNVRFDNGNQPIAVKFPTWSANGSVVWYNGVQVSGTNDWKVTINCANHSSQQGLYTSHIYAYDSSGSPVGGASPERVYVGSSCVAKRSALFYDSLTTTSSDGYTSSYTLYANNVLWGDGNDVTDMAMNPYVRVFAYSGNFVSPGDGFMTHVSGTNNWSFVIRKSDHGNSVGLYTAQIHVYNASGSRSCSLPDNKVNLGNVTGNTVYYDEITVSQNADKTWATIVLKNPQTDSGNPVTSVQFPTWRTGQSAAWLTGSRVGEDWLNRNNWRIRVDKSMFDGVAGTYNTHVYALVSPTERVFVCGAPAYALS